MTKKILLVDDDKDLTDNLERALLSKGYHITTKHSAREGLQAALSQVPDLIVLDVSMETDTAGFEFIYQIRSSRESSKYKSVSAVPIILLSAISQVTNSRFSLNDQSSYLPAISGFISKPVKIEDLLNRVKAILD